MERGDLLSANGGIFGPQGKAINDGAASDIKVLVVGNPANTNALIAQQNAPDVPADRFTAMTRLDHNRALSQLAAKLSVPVTEIKKMTIWGNHSATQYPDLYTAEVGGKSAASQVDEALAARHVHPDGGQARRGDHRGARLLVGGVRGQRGDRPRLRLGQRHRVDLVRRWSPTAPTACPRGSSPRSRAAPSGGTWEIIQGVEINDFSRGPHRRVGQGTRGGTGGRPRARPHLRGSCAYPDRVDAAPDCARP